MGCGCGHCNCRHDGVVSWQARDLKVEQLQQHAAAHGKEVAELKTQIHELKVPSVQGCAVHHPWDAASLFDFMAASGCGQHCDMLCSQALLCLIVAAAAVRISTNTEMRMRCTAENGARHCAATISHISCTSTEHMGSCHYLHWHFASTNVGFMSEAEYRP